MKLLVTGGAGYIGSHMLLALGEAGYDVVVYDNLSTGHEWAVLAGQLIVGDLGGREALEALFERHRFDAVVHLASSIVVYQSVAEPLAYYRNNTINTLNLLECCRRHGVNRFVFSSTASVYGVPGVIPIDESAPCNPINPYGHSKLMSERMLADVSAVTGLRYVALRYFNVAGADAQARVGETPPEATHLINIACEAALGKRDSLSVYGSDYDTPDGTCIRDYIHVTDLVGAHMQALDYLDRGGASQILNCGYGHGVSVLQVIDAVKRACGNDFPVRMSQRRAGDPAQLVASNRRIREILNWEPEFDDLDTIASTALAWEAKLPRES